MGRSQHDYPERLTVEQQERLEFLRPYVALINEKGRSGTVHHEELARLEGNASQPGGQRVPPTPPHVEMINRIPPPLNAANPTPLEEELDDE